MGAGSDRKGWALPCAHHTHVCHGALQGQPPELEPLSWSLAVRSGLPGRCPPRGQQPLQLGRLGHKPRLLTGPLGDDFERLDVQPCAVALLPRRPGWQLCGRPAPLQAAVPSKAGVCL